VNQVSRQVGLSLDATAPVRFERILRATDAAD
jgi:hypothetical protein